MKNIDMKTARTFLENYMVSDLSESHIERAAAIIVARAQPHAVERQGDVRLNGQYIAQDDIDALIAEGEDVVK